MNILKFSYPYSIEINTPSDAIYFYRHLCEHCPVYDSCSKGYEKTSECQKNREKLLKYLKQCEGINTEFL